MKFKIGTLFSGIGSPEFGAERVFGKENIENVFACDIDKFARESYLANHKVQTMYKDVTKVDFTKYENEIDLLVGGSPCFEAGTKVITKDEYKNIEDIKVGDYVLTHTGKYQKVLRTGHKKANIVTMKAQGVKPTNVTLNHPYYVKENVNKEPIWKEVQSFKEGDLLGIPIKNDNNFSIKWVRWKETSDTFKETTVYNLEVQNDNSYTANNLIVHNCQSFSLSGKRKGFEDTRGTLFFDYIRAIKEIKPKYFIFENVKGMVNHDKGNTIEVILNSFAELDYTFNAFILNSKDYNIPQNRERFFVVGTLKSNVKHKRIQNIPLKKGTTLDIKLFNLLAKKHNNKEIDLWCSYTIPKKKKLNKCINDILEENVDKKYFYTEEATKKLTKNSDVSVLYSIDRLKFDSDKRVYSKNGISPCLKARGSVPSIFIGAIRGRNVDNPNSREIGLKTEQRLEINENKICNCLTTVQKDNVLVMSNITNSDSDNKENILIRRLTPRECLRIQDFDDTFKIVVSNSQIYKQAGNSMSVGVMEALINSIKEFEEGKISEFHKNLEQNEILDDF